MASKKIKKLLKKVAPLLAVAGLGKAFMANRNRNASIDNNMAKEFGFGQMKLKDFGPYSSKRGFIPQNMMTSEDMANDVMFQDAMAAKGGRIKKTKKGGRAVRKANRSKKK
jgi:hypothetical protein